MNYVKYFFENPVQNPVKDPVENPVEKPCSHTSGKLTFWIKLSSSDSDVISTIIIVVMLERK